MKKRVLSLVMVFCMLVSLFPAGVMAEEPEPGTADGTEYEEDYAPVDYPEEELAGDEALPGQPEPVEELEEVPENAPEEVPAGPSSQEASDEEPPAETEEDTPDEAGQLLPEGAIPPEEDAGGASEEPEIETEEAESESEAADAETEEAPELLPVQVRFLVTPEDAILTVYTINETGEQEELQPEEDGSWLLLPGEYFYSASREGYEPVSGGCVSIQAGDTYREVELCLSALDPETEYITDLNPDYPWLTEDDLWAPSEAEIQPDLWGTFRFR